MTSGFDLRAATPADASMLAALSIEVWLNTYADEGVSATYADHVIATFTTDAFVRDMADPTVRLIVCHRDGWVFGYAKVLLSVTAPDPAWGTAEIETLYVRDRHKRMGIGAALLRRALSLAREQGHRDVFLKVNCRNAPAVAFYEASAMERRGDYIYRFADIAAPNYVYGSSCP